MKPCMKALHKCISNIFLFSDGSKYCCSCFFLFSISYWVKIIIHILISISWKSFGMWCVTVSENTADPESGALPKAGEGQWLGHSGGKCNTLLDWTRQAAKLPSCCSQWGEQTENRWDFSEWHDWNFTNPEKHLLQAAQGVFFLWWT